MRHPPFRSGPAMGGEFSTKEGAERLANIIRQAWARAGHDVSVSVEQSGSPLLDKKAFYVVRMPTLLNGLPR